MSDAEIKKIILGLGKNKNVELSLTQAKKLYDLLDEIFGVKESIVTKNLREQNFRDRN